MMKRFSIHCLLLCMPFSISAQDTIPLYPNRFSFQIKEEVEAGTLRLVRAAWEYTYIGKQKETLDVHNYDTDERWGFDTLTADQLAYFRTFQPVNAQEEILRRAADEQIVIINESHILPRHRQFTKELLSGLKAAGFSYFGQEALSNCASLPPDFPCDTLLNERGYPLYSVASGSYIREPQMSRLIREAHHLGFTIFAYESFGKNRDSMQAVYIAQLLKKDPEARIVVLCGFGHNIEVVDNETWVHNGKLMAYQLKQLTGIDPLTINQYLLSEAHDGRANDLYRMINLPESSVFINAEGKLFSGWPPTDDRFDMLVYHPRTQYALGRPTWLINEAGMRLYFPDQEKITIDYPIIFKVWPQGELDTASPIEVIERTTPEEQTPLVLQPGKYRLKLENSVGESREWEISVE
ncbi:MAG: hypothetical protein R2824_11760 [Saprospiraceae bacterium]|nr:hypothetical protein [Lewinella sp.]